MAEIEIKHLDRRTVARYLARGAISQEQYDKYLAGLSDVAENSEKLEVIQPGEDFDEPETTEETNE
jgi:hypothetical protein